MVFKRKFKKTSSHWGNSCLLTVTYHKVIYICILISTKFAVNLVTFMSSHLGEISYHKQAIWKQKWGQQEGRKRKQGRDEERHVCAMYVWKCPNTLSCVLTLKLFQKAVLNAGEFFKGGIKKQLIHEIFDISVNEVHVKKDSSGSNFSQ